MRCRIPRGKFVVNNNESTRPMPGVHRCGGTRRTNAPGSNAPVTGHPRNAKRPRGFPAGAIRTVDFLLHHGAAIVKKMAVKTHDRRADWTEPCDETRKPGKRRPVDGLVRPFQPP